MKKSFFIYPDNYLYKFIIHHKYFQNGILNVPSRIYCPPHKMNRENLFYAREGATRLEVQSDLSSKRMVYALIKYYERIFEEMLCMYIYCSVNRLSASVAVHEFRREFGIYESEFSWDAAYKKWQRSMWYQRYKEIRVPITNKQYHVLSRQFDKLVHENHELIKRHGKLRKKQRGQLRRVAGNQIRNVRRHKRSNPILSADHFNSSILNRPILSQSRLHSRNRKS